MKDNFSTQSREYARYRPEYPPELFRFLLSIVDQRNVAWDCGTGNGQVAIELARYFDRVKGTDISANQLSQAVPNSQVEYTVQPAESTDFPAQYFDLIVVAQALHWFDLDQFYGEAKRTLVPGGLLVVMGYGLIRTFPEAQEVIDRFYKDITGPYWDPERNIVEQKYRTIPFPFAEIKCPDFVSSYNWTVNHLLGYLGTWSAVVHFKEDKGYDPLSLIEEELKDCWGNKERKVDFPVFMRAGRNI